MPSRAWALACLFLTVPALAEPAAPDPRQELKTRVEALLAETKTACWKQKTAEWKEGQEERASAACFWQSPDKIRMEMGEGRGSGTVAIRQGDKMTGYSLALRFARMEFKTRDPLVLSLRGNSIEEAGFFDDLRYAAAHWQAVDILLHPGSVTLTFQDAKGLTNKIMMDLGPLTPHRHQWFSGKDLVAEIVYSDIRYNCRLSPFVWE